MRSFSIRILRLIFRHCTSFRPKIFPTSEIPEPLQDAVTKFILLYALVEGQNLNPFLNKSIPCLVKFLDERFTINFLLLLTVWLDPIFVDLELTHAVTIVALEF